MTPRLCWQNGPFTQDGCPTSCILDADHKGKHEWTRDDQIQITFAPRKKDDEGSKDEVTG